MGLGHRVAAASQHSFCGFGLRGGREGCFGRFLSPVTLGLRWRHWVRGRRPRGPQPVGDWQPTKLQGALGRPWAEVTAAEFLPGRFPEPPHRPCQGGGRRVLSCPMECRGLSSEYLPGTGAEGQPRPLTALSSPSLAADLLWVS